MSLINQTRVERECWESYGASDFRVCLRRCAPHHDDLFNKIPNSLLSSVWQTVSDANGIDACNHDGDGAYFPFEDVYGERGSNASIMWIETRKTILEVIRECRQSSEKSHPDDIV